MESLNNISSIKDKVLPVILCGGEGTRLWPLSRKSFPKQFLSINNLNEESLLQNTQKRLAGIKDLMEPILICNSAHRFIVAEQMREIDVKPNSILLEPFGRNTAPAILLSAFKSLETEKNAHLLILSADHQIKDEKKFRDMIEIAKTYSRDEKLVTFGVVPKSPETGYGYIKSDKPFNLENIEGIKIAEFIEKPDLNKAKELIKDECFTWNSGIFLFKAKTIINEIKNLNLEIYEACKKTFDSIERDFDFQRIDEKSFKFCPNISIDVAVMQNTKKGIVIPLDAQWSDIGSWKSVWENSNKDSFGNFMEGNIISQKTQNCYLHSKNSLLVSLGLKDLIIVNTDDATLVAHKNESEYINKVVKEFQAQIYNETNINKKVYRPWGYYLLILEGIRFKVKIIHVKPGAKLSLQMHHRAEHWIVVKGTAEVIIDENKLLLSENQSTFIPLGTKHRLSNPGKISLEIIEVQSGSYIGEDELVKFDNLYGRKD